MKTQHVIIPFFLITLSFNMLACESLNMKKLAAPCKNGLKRNSNQLNLFSPAPKKQKPADLSLDVISRQKSIYSSDLDTTRNQANDIKLIAQSEEELQKDWLFLIRDPNSLTQPNNMLEEDKKNNPDEAKEGFFTLARAMYDLTHSIKCCTEEEEEKEHAGQLAAHYFVKAVLMGNETAHTLLVRHYPQIKSLLTHIRFGLVPADQGRVKLLEKIAQDYWVKSIKTTTF